MAFKSASLAVLAPADAISTDLTAAPAAPAAPVQTEAFKQLERLKALHGKEHSFHSEKSQARRCETWSSTGAGRYRDLADKGQGHAQLHKLHI